MTQQRWSQAQARGAEEVISQACTSHSMLTAFDVIATSLSVL